MPSIEYWWSKPCWRRTAHFFTLNVHPRDFQPPMMFVDKNINFYSAEAEECAVSLQYFLLSTPQKISTTCDPTRSNCSLLSKIPRDLLRMWTYRSIIQYSASHTIYARRCECTRFTLKWFFRISIKTFSIIRMWEQATITIRNGWAHQNEKRREGTKNNDLIHSLSVSMCVKQVFFWFSGFLEPSEDLN